MSKGAENRCLFCMEPIKKSLCSACGKTADDVYDLQYAKPGAVLGGRYLLGHYARKNSEGALYAGFDNVLQQKVWIREYFPQTIAQRDMNTGRVRPLPGCEAQYKALMSDFVDICNEVRRLSVTEQVVPLENLISENNTVYAIYKGLELISFEKYLEEHKGRLKFKHASALLLPVCNTLEVLHSHGHIHRGISPHTLYLGPEGKLYLWDFALGATRTAGSELDSELFSGYSAPEQYSPNGWQGSWSDVYALGALFYRTLTGIVPPKSIRIDQEQNQLASLAELLPELPRNISDAVREAMNPSAEDRLQTVQAFLARIVEPRASGTSVYNPGKTSRENGDARKRPDPRHSEGKTDHKEHSHQPRRRESGAGTFKYMVLGTLVMLVILVGVLYYFVTNRLEDIIGGGQNASASIEPAYYPQEPEPEEPAGPEAVPNFIGRRFSDIEHDPRYQEWFTFSTQYERRPEWTVGGTIFEQLPTPGTVIAQNETVNIVLWVSLEDVEMPNLIGRTLAQATDILHNLEIVDFQVENISSSEPLGTVVRTMPEAGSVVNPVRDSIILFVPREPEAAAPGVRPPSGPLPNNDGGRDGNLVILRPQEW